MTAASPPALLPCPLCQSVKVFGISWACCTDCDCSAPIAAWNRRDGTAEISRVINGTQETERPMPLVYRQGWQDACEKIRDRIGCGDGIVREMADKPEPPEAQTQMNKAGTAELVEALEELLGRYTGASAKWGKAANEATIAKVLAALAKHGGGT